MDAAGPEPSLPTSAQASDSNSEAVSASPVSCSLPFGPLIRLPQASSLPSALSVEVVQKYFQVFSGQAVSSDNDSKNTPSLKNIEQEDISSYLLCARGLVQKLRPIVEDKLADDGWRETLDQATEMLLFKFHTQMSRYFPEISSCKGLELELVRYVLLVQDDRDWLKLSEFHIWLFKKRLENLEIEEEDSSIPEDSKKDSSVSRKRKEAEDFEDPAAKLFKKDKLAHDECSPAVSSEETSLNNLQTDSGININKDTLVDNDNPTSTRAEGSSLNAEHKEIKKGKDEGGDDLGLENGTGHKQNGERDISDGDIIAAGKGGPLNGQTDTELKTAGKTDKPSNSGKGMKEPNRKSKDEICIGSSEEDDDDDDEDYDDSDVEISSPATVLDARTLSRTDDPDGELFVINNTSEEEELEYESDEETNSAAKDVHRWRPCIKRDPFPVKECLHLMLEEAFFLSYGFGCLTVMDKNKPLNLEDMWSRFQTLKEEFVPHYVAYHYFRSKGWVPKSGLKFGCDYILYREGPPFYHGSYSVVVQCVRDDSLLPCSRPEGFELDHRRLSWISLAGLNRITEHVAKELMFCYVIWPKGLSKQDVSSPSCISKFKVKEVLVSRWVSSQERENKTEEEMP